MIGMVLCRSRSEEVAMNLKLPIPMSLLSTSQDEGTRYRVRLFVATITSRRIIGIEAISWREVACPSRNRDRPMRKITFLDRDSYDLGLTGTVGPRLGVLHDDDGSWNDDIDGNRNGELVERVRGHRLEGERGIFGFLSYHLL
ncbi:hypothetical protein TIFTF001_017756 [Ficus carica]|uniref:Uncharacterized protein n=1 Tax=Ficus carica TaxID=3494 RepID=A0AA88DA32_FICCA|nr:hypothetical protein TIFTF001_017756 [Ficus carica]